MGVERDGGREISYFARVSTRPVMSVPINGRLGNKVQLSDSITEIDSSGCPIVGRNYARH
jgi:hypothetical protein